MVKIKRALISLSDKTGIVEFASELAGFGVEILSTGGTAKLLRDNGISVIDVSSYTGFPEMLDGRVKTLHPKIHGGLLALRDNPAHMGALQEHGIGLIDMVVVNLYPFEKTSRKPGVALEEVIENIDIGGPSMLRSAAKNYRSVAVISDPGRYRRVIDEMRQNNGVLSAELLRELAVEAFGLTSRYDSAISSYLDAYFKGAPVAAAFPDNVTFSFEKVQDLRYGENPHQRAAFYREKGKERGLTGLKQLQGKELSFNNILDLHAAFELVNEFERPAAVVVKHNNPCGAAEDDNLSRAYPAAFRCDSLSAFGGIVALNRRLDAETGLAIVKSGFLECVIAPEITAEAAGLFAAKKNLRLVELKGGLPTGEPEIKRVSGGVLLQDKDSRTIDLDSLKVVTKKKPTKKQLESLFFAWKVAKHVKSNAIVLARGTRTVGIGAGQMSRVDAVTIARLKAGKNSRGSCLASDAFFPKPDAIAEAARAGVKCIIQPGGSIADGDIIKSCDKRGIAMVFTGLRHFRH